MSKVWRTLLSVFLWVGLAGAQEKVWQAEVGRLFEEAQHYHLGLGDRPVDKRKAFDLYRQAIQLDPNHADSYYNMANLCFEAKRYDLAIKYYQKVRELQPEDGHVLNNLGAVYERQGKEKYARRMYQMAIKVDSTVARAYYNLARLLSKGGDAQAAMAYMERALRLAPDDLTIVNQHARLEAELGKLSEKTILMTVGGFCVIILLYRFIKRRGR